MIKRMISWLKDSHRLWHIGAGFLSALVLGFTSSIAAAAAFEAKDVQYNKLNWHSFDPIDFSLTIAGGIVGGILHAIIKNNIL